MMKKGSPFCSHHVKLLSPSAKAPPIASGIQGALLTSSLVAAMAADLRLLLDATPHLRSCLTTPADIEELAEIDGCTTMAMRSTAVLEELHLELLLTHALDFRDALCLAATSP
jgi:hypothetical protein